MDILSVQRLYKSSCFVASLIFFSKAKAKSKAKGRRGVEAANAADSGEADSGEEYQDDENDDDYQDRPSSPNEGIGRKPGSRQISPGCRDPLMEARLADAQSIIDQFQENIDHSRTAENVPLMIRFTQIHQQVTLALS